MDWAIYGALIVGFLAVVGALAFLAVRILQGWRAFKRLRRHVGKELERLADAGERTADAAERAGDTTALNEAVGRLRVTLARFAVLRQALAESTDTVGRITAVYPRK